MATTITPRIVTVNTTVTAAPTPSTLQRSGAIISLGGSTLTTNTYQYCGNLAQLALIVGTAGNHTELTAMGTTFFAQGNAVGLYVLELGLETTPGQDIPLLQTFITSQATQLFYSYLCPATWDTAEGVSSTTITNGGSGYTSAPTVTFSAPGSGTTATGTAVVYNGAVIQIIITNPGSGYTAPPTITIAAPTSGTTATATATTGSALAGIANNYASPSGKTYFFVTTTYSTISQYAGIKSIQALVPSPTAASTEFQCAVPFYDWLSNNPSAASPAAPMAYRYAYGVTPWAQTVANEANVNTILTAFGNIIWTGAEGGISTACLFKGTTMDGEQAMFWYAVDWFQIQTKQQMAAAIINGSNSNPPLYYNQPGINTLLALAQSILNSSIKFGLMLQGTVTATPFYTYVTENPSDYNAGIYDGFSATVTPQLGFLTITFNLDALEFVAGG